MLMTRRLLPTLVTLAVAAAAGNAQAIGWGPASQGALIGQPLDFTASLRLDPGDSVAPECVHAEVSLGDQRMPPVGVRLAVDASQAESLVMRVGTVRPVDEPVVTVVLAVGCPARMSRRFVLLADPPDMAAASPLVADARPAATIAPVAAAAPAADAAPAKVLEGEPRSPATRPVVPRASTAPAGRHARRGTPRGPAGTAVAAAPPPRPRLELEAAPPLSAEPPGAAASAVESALEAVAQAASAARSAASAASAAQQRVAELETEVARLRREADASRQTMGEMRGRMAQADGASRWVWPLAALTFAFAALAGWLAWRLKLSQEQRLRAWRTAAAAQAAERPPTPTSQLPLVTSEIMQAPPYPARPATVGKGLAVPAPSTEGGPDTVPQIERTEVQAPPPAVTTTTDPGAARDVSIEELLDLEQQAEFFIVLGQDEAAIDLLVDHLRDTGGGSPLPYLKLLEIYRRRDDREAYERTRMRFNHRFNAYAPDWDADLASGRSLEDYPGVIPRLQQVWTRPLDAMAELEALLFRKSRGQLFELPAYREVLFLYSLARDLLDREGADTGNVDLLLPLADGSDFGATTPKPYLALERDSVFDHLPEDRPTAPVDLDLTQPDGPSSIVDPLTPRR